jgi:hypothetical protein
VRLPLFTVLLGSANVGLAAWLAVRAFTGWSLDALTTEESPMRTVEAVPTVAPAAPSFDSIQAQAVFHKSRSFYIAPESPVAQQPPPDYRLAGSMAVPNQPRSAVLVGNRSNARVKVVVGDLLEGWTVAEVTPTHVVVQLGERTEQIGTSTRSQPGGMRLISSDQPAPPPSAPENGMVRVLESSAAAPRTTPQTNAPADSAPRLYRPPVPQ